MKVILIDDDKDCLNCLSNALRLNDFDVQVFLYPQSAIHSYNSTTTDVVITDYHLQDTTGIEILNALKQKNPTAQVIIISGDPDETIKTLSLQAGAYAFFRKPLNISTLITTINTIPKKESP